MDQLQGLKKPATSVAISIVLDKLVHALRDHNLTVGFAESCTGGLLSSLLTEQSGVSDIFMGSVVSYSNQVKINLLGVQETSLKQFGAVSETVAQEMANGVVRNLKAGVAVAITGIAGPSGGTAEKPVGTVCFAVAGSILDKSVEKAKTTTKKFAGDRKSVQMQSAQFGMEFLNSFLIGKN